MALHVALMQVSFPQIFSQEKFTISFVASHVILIASGEAAKDVSVIKSCLHYAHLSSFSGRILVYQMKCRTFVSVADVKGQ